MNKRPLSVIIIAFVYVATGVIGVVFHLTELKAQAAKAALRPEVLRARTQGARSRSSRSEGA